MSSSQDKKNYLFPVAETVFVIPAEAGIQLFPKNLFMPNACSLRGLSLQTAHGAAIFMKNQSN